MALDRRPPVTVSDVRIEPNEVNPGGPLILKWTVVENRKGCDGETRQLIVMDGKGANQVFYYLTEPLAYHPAESSLPKQLERELIAPMGAAMGPAIYQSYVTRWCNLIQEHLVPITEVHEAKFTFVGK
jgi:hypothetical protein